MISDKIVDDDCCRIWARPLHMSLLDLLFPGQIFTARESSTCLA